MSVASINCTYPLRRTSSRAFLAAARARAAWVAFFENSLGHAGVLLKELHQLGVDHVGNEGSDLGVAQFCLGLAFKFSLLQLDRDNADQAFAHVRAGQILVLVLQQAVAAAVVVEHAGQAGLEALFVGAAVGGVDVVGEAQQQLIVAGINEVRKRAGLNPIAAYSEEALRNERRWELACEGTPLERPPSLAYCRSCS